MAWCAAARACKCSTPLASCWSSAPMRLTPEQPAIAEPSRPRHRAPSARSSGPPKSWTWTTWTWTKNWPSWSAARFSTRCPWARSVANPAPTAGKKKTPSAPAATPSRPKKKNGPPACSANRLRSAPKRRRRRAGTDQAPATKQRTEPSMSLHIDDYRRRTAAARSARR